MNPTVQHVRTRLFLLLVLSLVITHVATAQLPSPAQPSPAPAQAFQAIHLLWVDTQQPHAEERMRMALAGLNEAIRKAGCADCVYHLWRVSEGSPGSYNYMQQSDWPSRALYDKVHSSPDYTAASQAWAALRSVVTREVYVRQNEVPVQSGPGTMAALRGPGSRAAIELPTSK